MKSECGSLQSREKNKKQLPGATFTSHFSHLVSEATGLDVWLAHIPTCPVWLLKSGYGERSLLIN